MTKKDTVNLLPIFIILFLLNIYFGKDINWDQMNYHLYGVHLLLENRWDQDYFAGSFQGYLNPISYIPFYWMVKEGWNPIFISSFFLIIHFLNIVFIYLIIKKIYPSLSILLIFTILILSASAPIFLTVLGTSFNDATCSVFILAAFYIYLCQPRNSYLWMGLLCGISLAFKLTQAIYILSFLILIFFFDDQKIKSVFKYGFSTAISFLAVHSIWAWHLQREFGSPFFPFFNGIFKSSDFFQSSFHDSRFMGDYWTGTLTLPFEMALTQSWVYTESSNPDLRVAICFILALFYPVYLWKSKPNFNKNRDKLKLLFFFFAGFFIWALLSRIGRYAVTILLLAGPVIYILTEFIKNQITRCTLVFIILTAQVFHLISADFKKWSPHEWGNEWMKVQLPESLKEKKALFITTNTQSYSFLSMHLHKESGLINLLGQYPIPYKNGLPNRFEKLKNQFEDKYLVLVTDDIGVDAYLDKKNKLLLNYGLQGEKNCISGKIDENYAKRFSLKQPIYTFNFCKIIEVSEESRQEQVKESIKYDYIFDHIEKHCDKFGPKQPTTFTDGKSWIRQYIGTLSSIYIEKNGVFAHGYRILHPAYLGSIEDILQREPKTLCPDIYRKRYLY